MSLSQSPGTRYGLLALLTIQNTATVLCMRASMVNASAANQKYLVSTLILTMEMIKVSLIAALIVVTEAKFSVKEAAKLLHKEILCRPLDALPLAVPSFLYVVQDNLIVFALSCVDATTYQVTYQARILTTALFAKILLNQVLPIKRWLSLLLLMSGVILTQVNFHGEMGDWSWRAQREDATYLLGLLAIGCATMTSGFAGVYNEKIIKNGQQPLLLIRCFQLSLFCVFFAFMGVVIKDGSVVLRQGYFHGYTPFVWLIATMQAIGGIIVAGTMKYADNILKTFATAYSIALSYVLSYYFLLKRRQYGVQYAGDDDDTFTPTFLLGTLVIIFATFLYSSVKTVPHQLAPRQMDQQLTDPIAVPLLPSKDRRLFPQLSVVCAGFVIFSIVVFLIRQNTVVIDATQLGPSGNLQQYRAAGHHSSNRSYNLMEETELADGWTRFFNSQECTLDYLNANKLAQDHPCVIETIRRHYLNQPPSPQVPLKLDSDDIKDRSPGQTGVIMKLLKNQTEGFFADCGAHDGEFLSNTLDLERKFNWSGILIEANPETFQKLLSRNRKSWTLPICLSLEMFPTKVSFQPKSVDSGHSHIEGAAKTLQKPGIPGVDPAMITVQCFPFYSVLLAVGRTRIDFFSLDVEGHELKILQTIPWHKVNIKSLTVEWDHIPEGQEALTSFMEESGFIKMGAFDFQWSRDVIFIQDLKSMSN